MSEQENGESGAVDYGGNTVVQFRASRPATRESQPYLTDDERLALRRLIAMEKQIALAVKKLEHLEHACPTARREIRALLLGDE